MSFSVNPWKVVEHGWDPARMRFAESLTALGNGYMGMRGSFEEDYSGDSCPGMYLGGVWYPDKTRVGWWKTGYPRYYGKMLNAVKLIGVHVTIDGTVLDLDRFTVWEFLREVDMRTGLYHRAAMIETDKGSLKLECWRFVSMAQKELAAMRYTLTPSFDAKIGLMPYLDGDVRNEDANFGEKFWNMEAGWSEGDTGCVTVRTKPNPYGVPRFTVSAAQACAVGGVAPTDHSAKPGFCSARYVTDVPAGETITLEKFAAVYTDRDHPASELPGLAAHAAKTALDVGWDAALDAHIRAWEMRWEMADVQIDGDDGAQQGIRFNLFQLLSTYSGRDSRLNIPPKGFTGEKYGGATYWDTEAYCLPVYMAIYGGQAGRQLLDYRYHQLEAAYENAADLGLPGALYPMVTMNGRECHNEWEITFEELHRNAAIAYAIFNYTTYTGDTAYETHEGLEVLAGIARFWAGRVQRNARTGKYMLLGVTGPNNYEINVNNNWYTNRMAAWCITYFLECCEKAGADRVEALHGVTAEELAHLREIADNMYYPQDKVRGVFEQQDGYFDKQLAAVDDIPRSERPIRKHWSWDRVLRSCYIKQADVMQGMYFLNHLYPRETVRRNFDFYEPMTVHESGLSPSIHCILACQLGYRDKAVALYKQISRLDLDNIGDDTDEGLHVTSMAGCWLSIVKGFAGMHTVRGLSFEPFLPDCWTGYSFKLNYRGSIIQVAVKGGKCILTLLSGAPVELRVYGRKVLLSTTRTVRLKEPKQPDQL